MGENNMSINLINYALAKKDWEKAYKDLEVLGAGGRNYLLNSKKERQLSAYTLFLPLDEENKHELAGEQVVVSFEARHDSNGSPVTPHVYYRTSDGYNMGHSYGEGKRTTTEYQRFVIPIDEDKIPSDMTDYTTLTIRKSDESTTVYIRNIKLEKGNKATDWTPAPEDINAHPFVVELAETVYRSKQNEERIRNLENAITALGGGS